MEYEARMYQVLEHLLHDKSAEPTELPLSLLRAITNDFDDTQKIRDEYDFILYKGMLRRGKVAVKKLRDFIVTTESSWLVDDEIFKNEFGYVMKVKHKNIARFLGYCADTQGKAMTHEGKFLVSDFRHRVLCYEYPTGGSLEAHITDASHGLSWRKRYKIIRGICEGLYYLHQNHTIVHLNLKPKNIWNIWLDKNKEPKILILSMSCQLEEMQTTVVAEKNLGTPGYMAPEYYCENVVSLKADLFTLGALITEILTGKRVYDAIEEKILESWGGRFGTSPEDTCLVPIRVCTEIARSCLEHDPKKRPVVKHIIEMLHDMESTFEFTKLDDMESVDEFTPDEEVNIPRVNG